MWNQDYLKTHQLPEPKQFSDLAKIGLFWACHHEYTSTLWHHADDGGKHTGQIWLAKGWEILLRVGANLATASARSFGVSDYIANGQFAVGPTIDSYALILVVNSTTYSLFTMKVLP